VAGREVHHRLHPFAALRALARRLTRAQIRRSWDGKPPLPMLLPGCDGTLSRNANSSRKEKTDADRGAAPRGAQGRGALRRADGAEELHTPFQPARLAGRKRKPPGAR
jgi:hypothetical protein